MNKILTKATLMIMLAVPLGAVAAPIAYDINFTAISGDAPTDGSFTYDEVTDELTGLEVSWRGIAFVNFLYSNKGCGAGGRGMSALLDQKCNSGSLYEWTAITDNLLDAFDFSEIAVSVSGSFIRQTVRPGTSDITIRASGGWAISERSSQVPEPGSLALLGLGLAGMGFARRRKAA